MINTTPIVVNHYDVTSDANASGDAVQSDVALGKKFSSMAGTNITGTASLGVVNTGNAAVGDVSSGKTFSSSVLTNATGTSTKNATVSSSAAILPSQAFVDNILSFVGASDEIDVNDAGIISLSGEFLIAPWMSASVEHGNSPNLNASGNALSVTSVNEILSACVASLSDIPSATLDISLGSSAAPTGQGLTDKATLISAGWTVTTN